MLRLNPGAEVVVFDGEGSEGRARLGRLDKEGHLVLEVLESKLLDRESPLMVRLVQGLPRGMKMEWVLQKATELGVAQVGLLSSQRSVCSGRDLREKGKWSRWLKILEEASRQCGRNRVPDLLGPWSLDEFLRVSKAEALKLVLWESALDRPLRNVMASLKEIPGSVWLVVGPEGGFEAWEVEKLLGAGFVPVGLGPRILRTETVGVAALALLQFLYGDLG